MPQANSQIMNKARHARDLLIAQFIHNPEVVLIDIGFPPNMNTREERNEIVVRIHVTEHWFKTRPEERLNFPAEIDGIRVVVIPGDYHLE
jgi:hypothetical protein